MANQPNPAANNGRRSAWRGRETIGWLLLGLLIGLLIGWVVWPVEWIDAGLDDLSPAVRAQFVSATADAYVASGGQDPATALTRMHGFANPQAAVAEAIAFYQQSGDPNRAIRDVNLRSLASALGALPITGRAPAAEQEIGWLDWILVALAALLLLAGGIWIGRSLWIGRGVLARTASAQPTSASPPASGNQPAWVLPRSLTPSPPQPVQSAQSAPSWQPSAPSDQPIGTTLGQRESSPRVVVETWDSQADAPAFAGPISSPSGRGIPQPPTQVTDDKEDIQRIVPGFPRPAIFEPDAEDEELAHADELDEVDFDLTDAEEIEGKATDHWQSWEFPKVPAWSASPTAQTDEDDGGWENDWDRDITALEDDEFDDELDELDNELDDDEWDPDAEEDDAGFALSAETPVTPAAQETKARGTPSPPKAPVDDADDDASGFLPTVQGVLSSFLRGEKESSPAARGGKAISSFVAEFHAGILAYEQSFTITSTGGEDGTPLGACGVGISETLDKEAAHSDKVRVLDVWLYDGSDVRSYNQYLSSPGMDKEALAAQSKSSATITGEPLEIAPGLTFRIASKSLVLDCRVVAAEFLTPDTDGIPFRPTKEESRVVAAEFLPADTPPSPLRSVRIEMTARAAMASI